MNQILSVEMDNKKGNNKGPANIKSVVKFFAIALIIFAIFLVVTFILGNLIYLVATIAYTILAFITAVLTNIVCRILRELDRREESHCCSRERNQNSNNNNNSTQLLSITRWIFK